MSRHPFTRNAWYHTSGRQRLLIVLLGLVTFLAAAQMDLTERYLSFVAAYESVGLDELLALPLVLSVVSGALAWIKLLELRREVKRRETLETLLRQQAAEDMLTHVPNRRYFMERLDVVLRAAEPQGRCIAVLFLDLDGFKEVNDALGHEFGDQVLRAVSQRIKSAVRSTDVVARLGGDEFTILLEDVADINEVTLLADRVIHSLSQPYVIDGPALLLTVSVGIALNNGGIETAGELLRRADIAMYRAKAAGKARHETYDDQMDRINSEKLEMTAALRRAVMRQDLELHYQPKVDLSTGTVSGFEALVRWRHPQRGLLAPADFIPLAEGTGLIVPIGRWVLSTACTQLRMWQDQQGTNSQLTVGVNLSVKQFRSASLVEDVASAVKQAGIAPESLVLEITEQALMEDTLWSVSRLDDLKRLGVQIAIDDFGTGHNSLSYLARFPVDILKVDPSFVHEPTAGMRRAVLSAVLELGHMLGMRIVCEGVETEEDLGRVVELGSEMGQGYYFSRPVPVEDVTALLARQAHAVQSQAPESAGKVGLDGRQQLQAV